jgi:hypothetical protein
MAPAVASSRWEMRVQTPCVVRPPWRSRSSWPLRVSLTGSVHGLIQPMDPCRGVSSRRSGRRFDLEGLVSQALARIW